MRLSKFFRRKKFIIAVFIVFFVIKYAAVPIYRTLERFVLPKYFYILVSQVIFG